MKGEKIFDLFGRFLAEQASPEEIKLVDSWYDSFEPRPGIVELLSKDEMEQSMSDGFIQLKKLLAPNK